MKKTFFFICVVTLMGTMPYHINAYEKVGFFDMKEVLLKSDVGKMKTQELNKVYNEQKAKIQNVERDLRARKDYIEKNRSSLGEAAVMDLDSDYRKRFKDYQDLVKSSNEMIQAMDKKFMDEVSHQIMKVVNEIREKEKYTDILDVRGISYSKDKDITNRVLEEFNKYAKINYTAEKLVPSETAAKSTVVNLNSSRAETLIPYAFNIVYENRGQGMMAYDRNGRELPPNPEIGCSEGCYVAINDKWECIAAKNLYQYKDKATRCWQTHEKMEEIEVMRNK